VCSVVVLLATALGARADAGEVEQLELTTSITPPAPVQGDDVTVDVRVDSEACAVVSITLEVLVDDGDVIFNEPIETVDVEAVEGVASTSFELTDALPGQYHLSARCPDLPDGPFGGSSFEVATLPSFQMAISPQTAVAGTTGTITVIGQACPFPLVEVHILDADIGLLGFGGQVTVDVRPGGTWEAELPWTADMPADTYAVRARCGDSEGMGRHVYYDGRDFVLTAAAQPPAPPQPQPPTFTG
jgi:hypothetical protein